MSFKNFPQKIVYNFFKLILSIPENKEKNFGSVKNILIVRPHNQLGDLLAGISLFRALKEKYPDSCITLIVSSDNINAINKSRFIDKIVLWDKKKIINFNYIINFYKVLRIGYDIAIVPVLVSISFTSNMIARFSNSKIRIGCNSLNGKLSNSFFLFDRRVDLDWRKFPDSNASDRILDNVRPFGIDTKNFNSEINFDDTDIDSAIKFLNENKIFNDKVIIGIHPGAGKPANRWSSKKFIDLIIKIINKPEFEVYLTGSSSDNEILNYIENNLKIKFPIFFNKKITEVAALISISDLFITNDTGIMHVAGTIKTPQISLFGPTNPFNWAPIGRNKFFIHKSDLMDDIAVDDVFELLEIILLKNPKVLKNAEI